MKHLPFPNGDQMPALGLGTWKSEPGEVGAAILEAIRTGYRHIDCAPIYENEAEVGEALEKAFSEGLVKREDLWITSKLWNDSHRPEHVLPALKKTLKDLRLQYLDLYLIHWPVALEHGVSFPSSPSDWVTLEEVPIEATWQSMEMARAQGLTRHIGVSNFNKQKIEHLIDHADQAPEVNQVEMHPYLQQPDLFDFCRLQSIHMTAYSPLGSRDRPRRNEEEPNLMEDAVIGAIAEKHEASPAQVLLAWHVNRGASVIPKSVTPKHIHSNLAAADIALDKEDMEQISDLDRGFRFLDGKIWTLRGSPYSLADLWGA